LLLVHTLIPNSGLSVNGPWWFFGLIFYLYLLFPLLFRWINKWEGWAFFVICLVSYGLVFLFRYGLNLHRGSIVMMNPPGHLPEFCLGILLACSQGKRLHPLWLVMALAVFCLGNYFAFFYPFTFLSVAVLMVFATQWLKSLTFHLSPLTSHLSPLTSLGALSMALFAVHGFLRTPVLKWANTLTGGWAHFGSAMLYLLLSLGVAIAAKALYDGLESLLRKDNYPRKPDHASARLGFQSCFSSCFLFMPQDISLPRT
jgi:Acyltransferase family.